MFSFLFGKPTNAAAAAVPVKPPRAAGPSEATTATLKMLSERESDLDKRITMLEKQVERLTTEAVNAHKAGMKQKAILSLKKKNMYEEQIKTNSAMLLKIVEQKAALESTFVNADTLNAMSHATKAMKAEQAAWSVDRVHDLTDEIQDVKDAHREINELLQEPFSDGPADEDLMAELDGMVADRMTAELVSPVAASLPDFPVVPTVAPAAAGAGTSASRREETEMERELAALAALA